MKPLLEEAIDNCGAVPETFTADAGYWSDDNASFCEQQGMDTYIATGREKTSRSSSEQESAAWQDKGSTRRQAMRAKLITKEDKAKYARRKAVAEPPFGQIKEAQGFRRFLLRGMDQARQEWRILCASHNLLKLFRAQTSAREAMA